MKNTSLQIFNDACWDSFYVSLWHFLLNIFDLFCPCWRWGTAVHNLHDRFSPDGVVRLRQAAWLACWRCTQVLCGGPAVTRCYLHTDIDVQILRLCAFVEIISNCLITCFKRAQCFWEVWEGAKGSRDWRKKRVECSLCPLFLFIKSCCLVKAAVSGRRLVKVHRRLFVATPKLECADGTTAESVAGRSQSGFSAVFPSPHLQADFPCDVLEQVFSLDVSHPFQGHVTDAEDPVSCLSGSLILLLLLSIHPSIHSPSQSQLCVTR